MTTPLQQALKEFQAQQAANRDRIAKEDYEAQMVEAANTLEALKKIGFLGRLDPGKAIVYLDEFIVRRYQRSFNGDWDWEWVWGVVSPRGGNAQITFSKNSDGHDELLLAIQEASKPLPLEPVQTSGYSVRILHAGPNSDSEILMARLLDQGYIVQAASAFVDTGGDYPYPAMMVLLTKEA